MPFKNGEVPYSVVSVVLASGTDSNGYWEFRCTPAFAARWASAKREAERRFGRTIHIRAGWNIYRPLFSQRTARTNACKQGNCNGAAVEGTSSHGGEWRGRPCLAVDVDPNGLTWDQVDQAMEAAGFSARLITEAMSGIKGGERWHYIDFNAFAPLPAGSTSSDTPSPAVAEEEEDMFTIYRRGGSIRVVGNGRDFRIGGALTVQTGVDGTETLDVLAKGAKVVDLDDRQWDVMMVVLDATAGKPVTSLDDTVITKLVDGIVAKLPAAGGAATPGDVRAAVADAFGGLVLKAERP
ncbi:hypothetical protein [Microbacterium allomyrinae]|uniref:Uncharacterized protein n=1 Tax=Microbacterium allomyrinae TaxID=2830666 RepID=A0A9X1S3D3_9MICO|nr:hypothetical protein [Microbacterium allomyrinae]MCC2033059.1 hypothetical protein [Microbacterium allomyrinae]